MRATRRHPIRRIRAGREHGVALIVALIVLVIIGLTSASVMRGALSSDLVANNTRVQTLANQAAQIALKYCEMQIKGELPSPPPFNLRSPPANVGDPMDWETFENWTDADIVNEVPEAFMKSEASSFWPSTPPECMAQRSTLGTANTIVVTARGFSPDYAEDGGQTTSGSVVWLQYILAVN